MSEHSNWPKDLKHTSQREIVYHILEAAAEPISAMEIHKLAEELSPGYALSTVYRVLTAFEDHGMVSHSTLLGEDTALYEMIQENSHRHYAVCLSCHRMIPLKQCPFDSKKLAAITASGFQITGHKLELYGYCNKCRPISRTTLE